MAKKKSKVEKFYQSRRVWGAALSLFATVGIVLFPEQYELIAGGAALIASALGVRSFTKPKK